MIHGNIIGQSTFTLVGNWWWVLPQRVCLLLPVRCVRCDVCEDVEGDEMCKVHV